MKILLIDDTRSPSHIEDVDSANGRPYAENKHDIDIAKSAKNGIEMLLSKKYDLLLLDHDLGSTETGSNVLDFIENNIGSCPPVVRLVTANIIAGPMMLNRLKRLKNSDLIKDCSWIKPFKGT